MSRYDADWKKYAHGSRRLRAQRYHGDGDSWLGVHSEGATPHEVHALRELLPLVRNIRKQLWTANYERFRESERSTITDWLRHLPDISASDLMPTEAEMALVLSVFGGLFGRCDTELLEVTRSHITHPHLLRLLGQLEEGAIGLYRVKFKRNGIRVSRVSLPGEASSPAVEVAGLIRPQKAKSKVYLGSLVTFEGSRFLVNAVPALSNLPKLLRYRGEEFGAAMRDGDVYRDALDQFMAVSVAQLAWKIDISDAIALPVAYVIDQLESRYDRQTMLRGAVLRADAYTKSEDIRRLAAQGESEEDRATLLAALRQAHRSTLWWSDRTASFMTDEVLERLLPMAEIMVAMGLSSDGTADLTRVGDPAQQPLRLLTVPEDVIQAASLSGSVMTKIALRWADDNPTHASAIVILDAYKHALCERRFLATYYPAESVAVLALEDTDYDALISGLWAVFEQSFFDTGLADMGVPKRAVSRLTRALRHDPEDGPLALADLPMQVERLEELEGVGRTTIEDLKVKILDFACHWRLSRARLSKGQLDHIERRADSAADDISEGLAELEALFG